MKPVIEVRQIYKKYRIGMVLPYYTLRDELAQFYKIPVNFFKKKSIGLDGLCKNEFWALKDISFNVFHGEAIGVIGKNGMGKSTLLKILCRITPPTRGEIRLRGSVASLLEIGTGFQQELTGRENIFLNGAILGMKQKEIRRKFDEIVNFSEVGKFLDTPVKHYSSGMYMRLAFSIAAHLDPEILIVDEVLAVGDASFQKKCISKMQRIAKQGRAIIFVSHNMKAISDLCDKTILIKNGMIEQMGETHKIINLYLQENSETIGKKQL